MRYIFDPYLLRVLTLGLKILICSIRFVICRQTDVTVAVWRCFSALKADAGKKLAFLEKCQYPLFLLKV
jgi:hypothetical protein